MKLAFEQGLEEGKWGPYRTHFEGSRKIKGSVADGLLDARLEFRCFEAAMNLMLLLGTFYICQDKAERMRLKERGVGMSLQITRVGYL